MCEAYFNEAMKKNQLIHKVGDFNTTLSPLIRQAGKNHSVNNYQNENKQTMSKRNHFYKTLTKFE